MTKVRDTRVTDGGGSYVIVSALVLLREGAGCELGLGTGRRREEVDEVLTEPVPEMLALSFLPDARPKDLCAVFCTEEGLCPAALGSPWSGGKEPLPRSLNAGRSRSLPLPYFNKAKTIQTVSIS